MHFSVHSLKKRRLLSPRPCNCAAFTVAALQAALVQVGQADVSINSSTPAIMFDLIDSPPIGNGSDGSSSSSAPPPADLSGAPPSQLASAGSAAESAGSTESAFPPPSVARVPPAAHLTPAQAVAAAAKQAQAGAAGKKQTGAAARSPPPSQAPATSTAGGGDSSIVWGRRLQQAGSVAAPPPPSPPASSTNSTGACSSDVGPTRIMGFIFDAASVYKLRPVLKDAHNIPSTVSRCGLVCVCAADYNVHCGCMRVAQSLLVELQFTEVPDALLHSFYRSITSRLEFLEGSWWF